MLSSTPRGNCLAVRAGGTESSALDKWPCPAFTKSCIYCTFVAVTGTCALSTVGGTRAYRPLDHSVALITPLNEINHQDN